MPPEDWHEPGKHVATPRYRVVQQPPGRGYRHVVTVAEVRQRLSEMPAWMLRPLEVVQLSRMTRKKQTFPCYGMQWGSALYLYPIEENLEEYFGGPPNPAQRIEARMYGGRWSQSGRYWVLHWTEQSIKDYYLNNVLIHELGHLLDDRNTSYADRERYAEWFAIQYGYKPTRGRRSRKPSKRLARRHGKR